MAPHISVRESITWFCPGGEASEPTSTLVLTSAGNHFVDVRILKPREDKHDVSGQRDGDEVLPKARLEWGFAGTSATEFRDLNSRQIAHCTWTHFVDSKHPDAGSVKDEGDMFPQPPPNEHRTVERGKMINPTNGRMTEYEEVWLDVAAVCTDGGRAGVKVVVLSLCDDEAKVRGMVVRVGQFVQGVLRVGEGFACERWEWEKGLGKGWKREARVGDLFMPCGAAMEEEKITLGGTVTYGDYEWKVVELEGEWRDGIQVRVL